MKRLLLIPPVLALMACAPGVPARTTFEPDDLSTHERTAAGTRYGVYERLTDLGFSGASYHAPDFDSKELNGNPVHVFLVPNDRVPTYPFSFSQALKEAREEQNPLHTPMSVLDSTARQAGSWMTDGIELPPQPGDARGKAAFDRYVKDQGKTIYSLVLTGFSDAAESLSDFDRQGNRIRNVWPTEMLLFRNDTLVAAGIGLKKYQMDGKQTWFIFFHKAGKRR